MPVEELSVFLYKITRVLVVGILALIGYYLINIGNNYVDKDNRIIIEKHLIIPAIIGIISVIIIFKLFNKYTILSDTFVTIITSMILAYLLNPIINYFEEKDISRSSGVLLLYLLIAGGLLIFAVAIFPKITKEIKGFISAIPVYIDGMTKLVNDLISEYNTTVGELPIVFKGIEEAIKENISNIQYMFVNGIKSFAGSIAGVFSRVVSLVLTPIVTYYFLVDKDYFINRVVGYIPEKNLDETMGLFKDIDNTLSNVVRGRLIMAAYVGIAVTIMLLIFRIDYAIVIGLITGFADIIPYIGPFMGFIPAVIFAFMDKPSKAIWVSILFLLIQWTENNVLAPKVLGESAGLHPMVILLSIIIGGGMFGVIGMILAVPVVAVTVIVYRFFMNRLAQIE